MQRTIETASHIEALQDYANGLRGTLQALIEATNDAWATRLPDEALANATPYLQACGHLVLAWVWLDVGIAAARSRADAPAPLESGLIAALRYFHIYELPKVSAWLNVVRTRESVCRLMPDNWF